MNSDALVQRLLAAVQAQQLGAVPDRRLAGAPISDFPSVDLAVVGFAAQRAPVWAHVLFSRHASQGFTARVGSQGERAGNVHYWSDVTDANKVSIAWQAHADWTRLPQTDLAAATQQPALRFIAPYPASLLKLMVAIGLGLALDAGLLQAGDIQASARAMIVDSDNDATTQMVRKLHECGLIARGPQGEVHNALNELLASRGLGSLRLSDTASDGGWGNFAGSGVGHIHMTAWDTVRLLWLLDPDAPPAPWPGAAPLMSKASRDLILNWMGEPSPNRILFRDEIASGIHFFHKTGTTENYVSDAGIVRALPPGKRHYIVAFLSNLGSRYGPPGAEFDVSPKLSGLGLAVDAAMREILGA